MTMDINVQAPLVIHLDGDQRAAYMTGHGKDAAARARDVAAVVQAEVLAAVQARFGNDATVTLKR
jgi:hypothetical protein